MWQAVGDVLALAIAAAISPIPIIGVVLMLVTPRARTNGPLFLLGWLFGVVAVGAAGLALGGVLERDAGGGGGVNWVQVALGVVLLMLAARRWRKRPLPGEEPELPVWMGAVDRFTPARAAGTGVLLSAVNPKNLFLTLAATATIARSGIGGGEQVAAFAVYTAIASLGVAVPIVIYFALGDRAPDVLQRLKTWLARNNSAALAVVFLVIGVWLLVQGFTSG